MPSGRTHDIITATSTPIIGFLSYKITNDINASTILTLSYLFSSLMFNGDLDIDSRPLKRWSLFKWIWFPYKKYIPHRSIWSHGIIIGTVIRLIYLMPIFILLYIHFNLELSALNWYFIIIGLIGLELGNTVHTISDQISL